MPLHIRRLPGNISQLVRATELKQGQTAFNPSRTSTHFAIRIVDWEGPFHNSHVLLADVATGVAHPVRSPLERLTPTVNLFRGIEDVRIVEHRGRTWFTATCTHATAHQDNEIIVGLLTPALDAFERWWPLDLGKRPIKNVCPFSHDGALLLLDVYVGKVFEVTINDDDDRVTLAPRTELRWVAGTPRFYRGSTSPIHLHGTTWGCVAHDIIFNDDPRLVTRLSYLHHWLEFDLATGDVTFVSTPFWVAHWGVEYVSGLWRPPGNGARVELLLGIADRDAFGIDTTLQDLRVGK